MNYEESIKILDAVKKAKRVMLSCHQSADPDSIVSCLLVKRVLNGLNIATDVFTPEPLHTFYKHLDPNNEIKVVSFDSFDFSPYDMFFIVDINDLARFGIQKELPTNLTVINVDHHAGKRIEGLGLRDTTVVCTSELLFYLFEDWKISLTQEMLRLILIGIASDSDMFNYTTSPRLFRTVAKLMELGASYEEVSTLLWRNNSLEQFKFLSKVLEKIEIDKANKFAYSFLTYEEYKSFDQDKLIHPVRTAVDSFLRTLKDTNFGMVMVEYEKNQFKISVRSRTYDYPTLGLVEILGGGGHREGGGAAIKDMSFDKASEKLLQVAIKFAKQK